MYHLAEDTINHLDQIFLKEKDSFIKSRYVGLISVAAVTVYELKIKEIFINFSTRKNKVLGDFVRKHFERINGRVSYQSIKDEYVIRFGERYSKRFKKRIKLKEDSILKSDGKSIITAYNNVVTWRNQFAHEGKLPNQVTFEEVKDSYYLGKNIIIELQETMKR